MDISSTSVEDTTKIALPKGGYYMQQNQSSLGSKRIYRQPSYDTTNIGRVTSLKDFEKLGIIEVVFLDYGQPFPVWVVGDIEREPVTGDQVVIGYINGRKDAPYLHGFVKNSAYTTNFIKVSKDRIRLQLPIFDIGVKDGIAHEDTKTHLLDNKKLPQRAYIDLDKDSALISFPTSKNGSTPPAIIKVTATGVTIDHPTGSVKHHGGSKGVARMGDKVSGTTSGGQTFEGTITTASSKSFVD